MTLPPVVTSQREAQETLYHYMRATLQLLPYDVTLDNWRYGGTGAVVQCDDRVDQQDAPITFYDDFDSHVPPGTDYNDLVLRVGDIWKSWGWHVEERGGVDKPNRYGTSPDGYELNIKISYPPEYPPGVSGRSPCFPPALRDDNVSKPRVITRNGLQYDQAASSAPPPTR